MTELLAHKLEVFKTQTGIKGTIFVSLVALFLISLLSDLIYGSVTTASSLVKFFLLVGLGVSFTTLFNYRSYKKTPKRSFTTQRITPTSTSFQEETSKPVFVTTEDVELQEEVSPVLENTAGVLFKIRDELQAHQDQTRAVKQREFFAAKEEGAHSRKGRTYLGVNIVDIVQISEKYAETVTLGDIEKLVTSNVHDERIVSIWLLINSYKQSTQEGKQEIYDFYLENRTLVDNWDMVDLAARNIIGTHVANNASCKSVSDELISSSSLWDKRTAVMSAHPLVLAGDLGYAFSVAERLIDCPEELVQSSLGWVLKEAYKQDADVTEGFIRSHFHSLSKQAIRIGTERMEKNYRKTFLRGEFEAVVV